MQSSSPGGGSGWEPSSRLGYHVNRAARLTAKVGEAALRPLGLGVAYVPVLALLANDGPASQKELAARTAIEQPTMAQLLARMERAGLVRRAPDPRDRRSAVVSLTRLARSRLPAVRRALDDGHRRATAGLTADEVETLKRLLGRVIRNLEAVGGGAETDPPAGG